MGRLFLLIIFSVCLIVFDGFAQEEESSYRYSLDQDKENFENLMESETENSIRKDSQNLAHKYYLIAQELPDWLFSPVDYATTDDFFIGISDPGMDSLKALKLAEHRAKALLMLAGETHIDNLSDNFTVSNKNGQVENQKSQYLDFTRLSRRKILKGGAFSLDKTFYTKYGEGIVLVSLQSSNKEKEDTLDIQGEFMQLARENEYGLENTVFCKLNILNYKALPKSDTVFSEYLYKGRGRRFNLQSVFQHDTIKFPAHPYRYKSSVDTLQDSSYIISNSLSAGLWNSYINTIFSNISYYNKNLRANVKSSYDNYSLKNQGIIRTVSRNRLSFSLNRIIIRDNELFLKVNWQETR
ncbi:MAG: hypothetical protein ACQESJ_06075 [Bacteroidota bacterium]